MRPTPAFLAAALAACTTVHKPKIITAPKPKITQALVQEPQPAARVPGQKHFDFDGKACWTEDGKNVECPAGILLNEPAFKQALVDKAATGRLLGEARALVGAVRACDDYQGQVQKWATKDLPDQMAITRSFWDKHGDKVAYVAGVLTAVLVIGVAR